ncbi:hypothetical protein MAR_007588 [Mya arenaria]|uniref:Uncharacterized protein n=1 Tax=Mya arenaria TaxID=6604 RepID=A0ABY7DEF0_MYAAR|nr:hypothetical protein MAR_007588 [Mya arenaria]
METTSQGPGTYAQATASTVLKIPDVKSKIWIDRAHRMGAPSPAVNLKGTPFNVFDQLPQEVQLRRKALIPEMVKLRAEGKRAFLIRDKLFVNNKPYPPGEA